MKIFRQFQFSHAGTTLENSDKNVSVMHTEVNDDTETPLTYIRLADASTTVQHKVKLMNRSVQKVTETIVHTQQKLSLQTVLEVMRSHRSGSTLLVPRSCRDWRAALGLGPADVTRAGGGVGVTRQTTPHVAHILHD